MRLSNVLVATAAIALGAACSDTNTGIAETETRSDVSEGAVSSDGRSVNLADYGFIDGTIVSPIAMPDWLPANVKLPDDFVPVEAFYLPGVNASILRGVTREPFEGLFDSISTDLIEAGYDVRLGEYYREESLIYFAGNGYEDSTIKIIPGESDTLLEISLVPSR